MHARALASISLLLAALSPAGCSSSDVAAGAAPSQPGATADAGDDEREDAEATFPRPTGAVSCDGVSMPTIPDDPGARGPWAVGVRTITVAGLTTEVWYPAATASESGRTRVEYDIREHLPDADRAKIPDSASPPQRCDCYRDLPLDETHGPYAPVLFIHGTAAFRTQSLTQMTFWASRGFVVLAADHPKIQMRDLLADLGGALTANQRQDASNLLDALARFEGDLSFLAGHVDLVRLGMAGHSAGGMALNVFGDRARVLVPMAGGAPKKGPALISTLELGAIDDGIVQWASEEQAYAAASPKKRLVGLSNAGHLAFSDICALGADQGGILAIAQKYGVAVPDIVAKLAVDGCDASQLSPEAGWAIVNATSTAALEETLACAPARASALAATKATFVDVGAYEEQLE